MIKRRHNNRTKIFLITVLMSAVFLITMLLLWFLDQQYATRRATPMTYQRQWITPSIKFSHLRLHNQLGNLLPHSQWQDKSVILYVTSLPCVKLCAQNLSKLQTIYRTYPKQSHLDILVATFSATKDKNLMHLLRNYYPRFVHVHLQKHNFLKAFSALRSKHAAIFASAFYLVNSKGRITMDYPCNVAAKAIEFGLA